MKRNLLILLLSAPLAISATTLVPDPLEDIELTLLPNTGDIRWNTKLTVYEDHTYNSFFRRTLGWNGGDGVYTTALPNGYSFWSFGDSFFGEITGNRNRNKPNNFPRNAAMIQTGESLDRFLTLNQIINTQPGSSTYYNAKTWMRHPAGEKTTTQLNQGETDQEMLYWPGDATVYKDTLQLIWGQVNKDMVRTETGYAEYSLKGVPGDGEYMKRTRFERYFKPYTTNYGSGIWEDEDGHTYLYGNYNSFPVVARSETHDLKSKWSYYVKTSSNPVTWVWQEKEPTKDEMANSGISPHWVAEPCVFKYADNKYYLVGQEGGYGRQIYIWQADAPWGPFKDRKILYATPAERGVTYNGFLHPQFSKKGEMVISYNASPSEEMGGFWANFNASGSADLYTPYFVRVFNWQSLYPSALAASLGRTNMAEVMAYPNPVLDVLNVEFETQETYRWTLTALSGHLVGQGQALNSFTIDMRDCPRGTYLLKLRNSANSKTLKIIK